MSEAKANSARAGKELAGIDAGISIIGREQERFYYLLCALILAVILAIWCVAVRAPLWLDETMSYWQISSGLTQIWARHVQSLSFPAYAYILWFATKIMGSSEMALRIPSLIAMLGAAYLLYLAARELFEREIAILATILFCLNPVIVFAAVDVRPYAFGVAATNAVILCLLRMRENHSAWLAALFGLLSACVLYFHFLMGAILPAVLICFFVIRAGNRRGQWRQIGIALSVFILACLPLIPAVEYLFHSPESHVFELAPTFATFAETFAPVNFLITRVPSDSLIFEIFFAAFVAAVILTWRQGRRIQIQGWKIVVCALLAMIPLLILFGVSAGTSIHFFSARHRIEAIPGIALCWAMLFTLLKHRGARLFFCMALLGVVIYQGDFSSWHHNYSWKGALATAEWNASQDNSPVVICSDFPESDYATMPVDSAQESIYFTQLSYYKLSVPVVPMPRGLNDEAVRLGTEFLVKSAQSHQRFLALGYTPSYKTLNWLASTAATQYDVRILGKYDGVAVLEFVPRSSPHAAW